MTPSSLAQSSLQLKSYVIQKLTFAINESFEQQKPIVQPPNCFSVTTQLATVGKDTGQYNAKLNVQLQALAGSNLPYTFSLEILGHFQGPPLKETDNAVQNAKYVYGDASAQLYGAARECLRGLTAQAGWPSALIPSINFSPS